MKTFSLLFLFAFVLAFASCTREYTCQCVVKYTGTAPGLPDSSIHEFAIKNNKKDAAAECEANSAKSTDNGITMNDKCQLY